MLNISSNKFFSFSMCFIVSRIIVALNQSHYVTYSHLSISHLFAKWNQILLKFCFYSNFFIFFFFILLFTSLSRLKIIFLISDNFSTYCFFLLFSIVATFYHWLERQSQTSFYFFDILISIFNQITQFAWSLHEFLQIDHFFISLFSNLNRRTIEIFTIRNYKSFRTRTQNVVYSSQWIDDVISLQNALNQFRIDIVNFRQSNVFRNFSTKFEIVTSSIISNSSFSSIFRVQFSNEQFFVFRLDIFIRFEIFTIIQFETSINSKFRRNNNSKIHEFIFSSIVFNYSSITNFDFDLNISRQFIVESNIANNECRSINFQIDNNQTFFSFKLKKFVASCFQ